MDAPQADPPLLMTISEAIRIDRRIPGAMTRVVERNCIGGGTPRPEEPTPNAVSGRRRSRRSSSAEIRIVTRGRALRPRDARPQSWTRWRRSTRCSTALRDFDARKTIVYVSNGVVFDNEIQGRLRDVGAKVAAAGATFYAIQIYTPPMDATASGLSPDWEEDRRVRGEGLDYLAGVSGGALFRPVSGLGTIVGADRARDIGPLRARLPGAASRARRQAARHQGRAAARARPDAPPPHRVRRRDARRDASAARRRRWARR